jgi:hypothetical protein
VVLPTFYQNFYRISLFEEISQLLSILILRTFRVSSGLVVGESSGLQVAFIVTWD